MLNLKNKYIKCPNRNVPNCPIFFILASILFAIPSIQYLLENKTILNFNEYFQFCLNNSNRVVQTIIYLIILTVLTIFYFLIVKNRDKLFKSNKQMYLYIAIISLIFVIVVPPKHMRLYKKHLDPGKKEVPSSWTYRNCLNLLK